MERAAAAPAPGAPRGPPGLREPGASEGGGPRTARLRARGARAPGLRRGRAWARERARAAQRREGAFRGRRESLVLSLGTGAGAGPPVGPAPVAASPPLSPAAPTEGGRGGRGAGEACSQPPAPRARVRTAPPRPLSSRLAAARFAEGGAGPRLAAARAAWDAAGLDIPAAPDPAPPPELPSGPPRKAPPNGVGHRAGAGGASLFPFLDAGGAPASPPWGWGGRPSESWGGFAWPPGDVPGPALSGASPAVSLSF